DVVVDLPTSTGNGITPVSDMSINFIRQNFPGSITEGYTQEQLNAINNMNFNLRFTPGKCSENFLTAHYYSDVEYGSDGAILTTGPYVTLQNTSPSDGEDPNMSRGLINRAQTKRIAAVTVQVFRADDTTGEPTGTVLATSTTTKTV
ncbi:MAG: hypothetical protein VZQ83_08675, partial [Eubacterium sp.]|nr:hypothetical protein [Eubacterium sp.]